MAAVSSALPSPLAPKAITLSMPFSFLPSSSVPLPAAAVLIADAAATAPMETKSRRENPRCFILTSLLIVSKVLRTRDSGREQRPISFPPASIVLKQSFPPPLNTRREEELPPRPLSHRALEVFL